MNHNKAHTKLCDDLLYEIGSQGGFRIFPRRVGLAIPIHTDRLVYFGIEGEADLQGWYKARLIRKTRYHGGALSYEKIIVAQAFAIEVKTGSGKLTKAQENWKAMFLGMGGVYVEARELEQAKANLFTQLGYTP